MRERVGRGGGRGRDHWTLGTTQQICYIKGHMSVYKKNKTPSPKHVQNFLNNATEYYKSMTITNVKLINHVTKAT